ncbi:hypothetical protein FNAPI_5343 [Fusarium napiforme]|uniref:DUF7025 domain-containing protein n=1 Tax=Fusarium napiforme TaxID=42672 RepID=A0A8H5JPG7_9HYPO|nr:hypothetical protein FNAPI_5343 [Fusarium napiforme]
MANIPEASNFDIFQQVLQRNIERPSSAETAVRSLPTEEPVPTELPRIDEVNPPTPEEPEIISSDTPARGPFPFLRQTITWDEKSQSEVELLEAPNDDWTEWTSCDKNTLPRPRVWQRRQVGTSRAKEVNRLVLREGTQILQLLFPSSDGSDRSNLAFLSEESEGQTIGSSGPVSHFSSFVSFHENWEEPGYTQRALSPPRKVSIDHEGFRDLFFGLVKMDTHKLRPLPSSVTKTFDLLVRFIDHIFPGARNAYENTQVHFHHLWVLFKPGDIVYEKRYTPPFRETYEQCFRVKATEESISQYDGTKVYCLVLEEIVYIQSSDKKPGPRLVSTTRHIREYSGLKRTTTEELGIIPWEKLPKDIQRATCDRISRRSRQFLHVSALPFSIWHYVGPLILMTPQVGPCLWKEVRISQAEKLWQRHASENVVIDLATSRAYFDGWFDGMLHSFPETEMTTIAEDPIKISPSDTSENTKDQDQPYHKQSLLICRGYLPAYLLSSNVHATHVLVDQLRPAVWGRSRELNVKAPTLPNVSHWYALIRAYLEEQHDFEAKLGRREPRSAGIVLALQGPRIITKMVIDDLSAKFERPLISLSSADDDLHLPDASKCALKWGGILSIDHYNVSMGRRDENELGSAYENEIDGVLTCNTMPENSVPELWRLYIATELPEVTGRISNERLNDACQILAQLEPRESRMGKILKTAKRMAVVETSDVGFGHVLSVIRSSLSSARSREVEDILSAGNKLLTTK